MKAYKYYVVYETYNGGISLGKGCGEVCLKAKISRKKDIEGIERGFLASDPEGDCVIILNYILMDEVEVTDEQGR